MELRLALNEQYHAGLSMLSDCVLKCSDDKWNEGKHPRQFWRIAFHTAFFTHLYLGQNEAAFEPWPGRKEGMHHALWHQPKSVEPFELPESAPIYSRAEILDYIRYISSLIGPTLDTLNLDSDETGFSWYENMSKMSHVLMNLRHLQGHVGQLSELLMAQDVDTAWIAKGTGSVR